MSKILRDISLRDFGASLNTVESYTNESSYGKIGLYEAVNKQKCIHLGMFLASDMDNIKILLSLDQSTKKTGFCIVKNGKYYKSGVLVVNENEKAYERMRLMNEKISELISKVKPDYVVFEQIQFQHNYSTYRQLAQLQGIIMAYLFTHDIPFTVIESTAWKSFIGITGKKREEQKKNTQKFVLDKYGLDVTDDEADSIGIAEWSIAHIIERNE